MSDRVYTSFNKRNIKRITAAYTLITGINVVYAGGSSDYAITLYDIITSLRGTTGGSVYIENNGTAVVTLTAATDDTLNGYSTWALQPGQRVVLQADKRQQKWLVSAPDWMPLDISTQTREIVVETNGTTAVDVFGPSGAPRDMELVYASSLALDTTAGNIIPKTAGGNVVTIAKGTTAGVHVGGVTLLNTSVEQGGLVTVESSSAGNSRVTLKYIVAAGQNTP